MTEFDERPAVGPAHPLQHAGHDHRDDVERHPAEREPEMQPDAHRDILRAGDAGHEAVNGAEQQERDEAIGGEMGVADGVVGEMQERVGAAEGLQAALQRGGQIRSRADRDEPDRGLAADHAPRAVHGQEEIPAGGDDRNHHADAGRDRRRLQPPRQRREDEMMRADQRVEHEIGPEGEHAQRIGIDRLVQHARQRPIGDAEHQRREPQSQHHVHVIGLDHDIADAAVERRQVADHIEDRQPGEGAEDEPVGDVELFGAPPQQRHEDVGAVDAASRPRTPRRWG